MNGLQVFENDQFGKIRTVMIDGEPWFVLKDVCDALGISNARDTARRLDNDEVGQTDVIDTAGRKQKMYIVNESGLYNVVLRSDKLEAKAFKRWITHVVLPTLRKTGAYSVPGHEQARIEPPSVPLGALVRLMEFEERLMREKGCTAFEISAAAKGLMDAYGVPVTKAFAKDVDPQMCLFDTPATAVPQLPTTAIG